MSSLLHVVIVSTTFTLLSACATQLGKEAADNTAIPVSTIKPEIDYSAESPGCALAAQRISDNVQVGMTLADVRRLVGQPRVIVPGRWFWSGSFSRDGRPSVRYEFGPADDTVPITAFSTDSFGC